MCGDLMGVSEVLSLLRPFAREQECFLRFASIPFLGTDKPIRFAGALDEVIDFLKENKYQLSPEYLWPADRGWCVCSDYDLTFPSSADLKNLFLRYWAMTH